MAAVLGNGIAQLCQGLCTILAVPCKVCGTCCAGIGQACGGCCKVTGKACGFIMCQSPFTPYILVTFALQIPPIVWGVLATLNPADGGDCDFVNLWVDVYALLAVLHLVGAFYLVFKMAQNLDEHNAEQEEEVHNERTNFNNPSPSQQHQQQPPRGKYIWEHVQDFISSFPLSGSSQQQRNHQQQQQQQSTTPPPQSAAQEQQGGSNSWKRLGHLMCYDVGVAIYMIVFIAWIIWLPIGISTLVSMDEEAEDDEDCDRLAKYSQGAIICGFVYGVMVALSFCCSLIFLKI